jgi:hypothetical protein
LCILFGIAIGVPLPLVMSKGLTDRAIANPEAFTAHECGFEAFEDARMKFDDHALLPCCDFVLFVLILKSRSHEPRGRLCLRNWLVWVWCDDEDFSVHSRDWLCCEWKKRHWLGE